MNRHFTLLIGSAAACAIGALACTHSITTDRSGPKLSTFETPTDLIEAEALLGGTDATRLHRDNIRRILEARGSDQSVADAFDTRMHNASAAADGALIRAMEIHFIHDPDASVLDLLGDELTEHFRQFAWDDADYPGGPEGPNENLADVMVDTLDLIRPERRANSNREAVVLKSEATEDVWDYMTSEWLPVPGQEDRKLNRHALESFIRMRDQAKLEGVDLVIKSSHRLREVAERSAARTNNPNAVASFSSHSLGLAVDFQMSQEGQEFAEVTTRPMSDVIRMRESPVHKWLFLRADDFGWYPYQNEPWHWEYNPPGFRDVFFENFPGGAPKRDPAQ